MLECVTALCLFFSVGAGVKDGDTLSYFREGEHRVPIHEQHGCNPLGTVSGGVMHKSGLSLKAEHTSCIPLEYDEGVNAVFVEYTWTFPITWR